MLIAEKMLIFVILMLVGLLLVKRKIIDERTSRSLSVIVLYVANPALIIMSSQTEHTIPGTQLLTAVLIAAALYAVLIASGTILPKLLRVGQSQESAYTMMTVFSNIGYMGIPLVSEIYGKAALLYVSIFILLYNMLIYTYGVIILQRKANPAARERFSFRKCLNPGVISSIIAVIFYLLKIRIPEILTTPLGYLSNLTAPLGMMIIGVVLADIKIRSFFTEYKLPLFAVIKLLILPIVSCFVLKLMIGTGDLLGVCIVMMATPVGSMTVMMAQQYGGESTLLSKGVAMTTLLCIVTIPIVFAVLL